MEYLLGKEDPDVASTLPRLLFPVSFRCTIDFCVRASRRFPRSLDVNTKRRAGVVRRGTTASSLHPCHLLLPTHPRLFFVDSPSPIPFCIAPKGRSLRLFPLRVPSRSVCSLCTASRLLLLLSSRRSSFFSCYVLLLLPFPPSFPPFSASLFVPPAIARFLFAPRFVSPFSPFSFLPALRFSLRAGPVASFVLPGRTRTTR